MHTVKAAREEKGWSKHPLAKEAGVNNHAVANIENGTYLLPRPKTVRQIAAALGGDIADFDELKAAVRAAIVQESQDV